jgi:WD40 repeat protein
VRVWNISTGNEAPDFHGEPLTLAGAKAPISLSADGLRLATGHADTTVRVWDMRIGAELFTLHGVEGLVFSPDGERFAASGYYKVFIGNAARSLEAATLPGTRFAAYSADGKLLAFPGHDQENWIAVWDIANNRQVHRLQPPRENRWGGLSMAFSGDGRCVVAAIQRALLVWDARTGELVRRLSHTTELSSLALSPDGATVAAGGLGFVKLWDTADLHELCTLNLHNFAAGPLAFSPDGQRLAIANLWSQGIEVWEVASRRRILTLDGHPTAINSAAFSPDGRRLATASGDAVRIWDLESRNQAAILQGHTDQVSSIAFSPDGKRLASASLDKTVKLWDTTTGQQLLTLRGFNDQLTYVTFSPDGDHLLAAYLRMSRTEQGGIAIWDATPLSRVSKKARAMR